MDLHFGALGEWIEGYEPASALGTARLLPPIRRIYVVSAFDAVRRVGRGASSCLLRRKEKALAGALCETGSACPVDGAVGIAKGRELAGPA